LALYNRVSLLGSYGEFLWAPLLSPTFSLLTGQRLDFHNELKELLGDAVTLVIETAGSRYFCESLFWASQPKQAAKT
jgi:hypothetical protein